MNNVFGSISIEIDSSGTTSNARLTSTKDLVQYYREGTASLTPSWDASKAPSNTANQPEIYPLVTDSSAPGVTLRPSTAAVDNQWRFNGAPVTATDFTQTTITRDINGTSYTLPCLRITSDVMADVMATTTIEWTGRVEVNGYVKQVSAMIPIATQKSIVGEYVAKVAAADGSVSIDAPSELLTAVLTQEGAEITSGLTYQWSRWDGEAFLDIAGATARTLTVTIDQINGAALYQCAITLNAKAHYAQIQVYDISDPYQIDFALAYSSGVRLNRANSVTVTPSVINKNGPVTGWNFTEMTFVVPNGAHVVFSKLPATPPYVSASLAGKDAYVGGGMPPTFTCLAVKQ